MQNEELPDLRKPLGKKRPTRKMLHCPCGKSIRLDNSKDKGASGKCNPC